MASKRTSINEAALALCQLVFEGGMILPAHVRAAEKLADLAKGGGVYKKRYTSHEERVLNRHLNLYKNKLKKATKPETIDLWMRKIAEQKDKLRRLETGQPDLDLDGL